MNKISKEDVKKIAEMTKLCVQDANLEDIQQQLNDVLSYAQRVQQIAQEIDIPSNKNINHDREDIAFESNTLDILNQAPAQEDNYFVVPKIIDNE